MFHRMFAVVAILAAASIVVAKPERKPPVQQEEKKKQLPDLTKLNPTNWGDFEQVGKNFKLTGHPSWEAVGVIRDDGKGGWLITMLWTKLDDGAIGPGAYIVAENGELVGAWCWDYEAETKDGKLVLTRPGRFYRVPPRGPEL